jgi:hypothetical protein
MAVLHRKSSLLVAVIASLIASLKRVVYANGGVEGVVLSGQTVFTNPAAADLVSVVADVLLANGALTIAAQPACPCKLQVRITDANSSISAGTLTLSFYNARGQLVSQVISLAGGTRTVTTTEACAKLVSATVASLAGNASGDNVGIGQSGALGLPVPQGATNVAVHRADVDGASETVGTVDATAGTLTPTTATNGTHDYVVHWTASLNAAGSAGPPVHLDRDERAITAANASDLATSQALVRAIGAAYYRHINDTLGHLAVDDTNLIGGLGTAPSLADVQDAANGIKSAFNAHRSQAGVHVATDAGHAITSPDASDLPSAITLLNELKTDINAHFTSGVAWPSWRVTDV